MNKKHDCNCGKPKCDGHCGASPAVLQINNPSECVLFHRVEVPASMGDSETNPPKSGAYKNVLLYYEADQTSWLYSSDGVPQKLVNGLTNYEDAINLPQINGVTLLGDKSSADLKLADAPMVITVANGNTSWSGADTAEDVYDFFLNKGKVNIIFDGDENYSYEIVSAAYIPWEEKMMCTLAVATMTGGETTEFDGNALFGTMTLYTADKAIDVSQIELQPKLYVADFTGLDLGYNELSGLPATTYSIGMVKPSDGLSVSSDGTLTVINHVFDTVADMQAASNLVNGSYARTLGYHSANDGGAALYQVKNTGTADTGAVIALAGDLFAHLVYNDSVTVEQFGAKGDGTTDDQDAINAALSSDANVIKFIGGKTYGIKGYEDGQAEGATTGLTETTGLVVPSNKVIELNECNILILPNSRQNYNGFTLSNVQNIIIRNGTITGDVGSHTGATGEWGYGISLRIAKNVTLDHVFCTKCWGDGINLNNAGTVGVDYNTNIVITDCECVDNRRQGMSIENARGVTVRDSKFTKTGYTAHTAPSAGVDIEPISDTAYDISFDRCQFTYNYGAGIVMDGASDNIQRVTLQNSYIFQNEGNTTATECFVDAAQDVKILNNIIDRGTISTTVNSITLCPDSDIIFRGNKVHNFRIALSCYYDHESNFFIEDNEFYIDEAYQYNDIIETTASSNASAKGKLFVNNNIFKNTSGNNMLNIRSWIGGNNTSKIECATIKNNTFTGGKWGIRVFCSIILHNNTMINTYDYPVYLLSDSTSNAVLDIQNNVLQQTCFNANTTGILSISNARPFIVRNNIFYKSALDKNDAITYTAAAVRWIQTDQYHAASLQEYNNIIDNTTI